jgi:hypothetical protein
MSLYLYIFLYVLQDARKTPPSHASTLLQRQGALFSNGSLFKEILLKGRQRPDDETKDVSNLQKSVLQTNAEESKGERLAENCEMCDNSFVVNPELFAPLPLNRGLQAWKSADSMPLFRHYTQHEPWPGVEYTYKEPGEVS